MTNTTFSIADQVALVTGATGGIGADIAAAFGRAGARVAVAGRRVEAATVIADRIREVGGEASPVELDLTDRTSIEGAVAATVAAFGRIDILVNSAGLGTNHDAIDATEAEWDDLFAVNVRGLFFACQSAARRMLPQGSGRILNMASQAGLVGIERHAAYSASKAAVIGLTKVLALEWSPAGVTVNAVARIPAGRVATTDEIAAAFLYLASPAAAMVTGTVLTIDGGWTAR